MKIKPMAVLAITLAFMPALQLRAAGPLTLAEAVKKALAANPDLSADVPGIDAARHEASAALATWRPRVDVEQSYTGGNNPVYVFGTLLTQRAFTASNFALPSLNRPDALDNLQTRIVAQQNIWDFGRSRQRTDGAKLGVELTERGRDEHVRQVLLAVVDTYHSVALAREAQAAARASLQSAESILEQARQRVASGLAVESDLLRGQAYLAEAKQREIEASGQYDIAGAMLNRLMGESIDGPVPETSPLSPMAVPLPAEEALRAEQKTARPDYRLASAQYRQAELEARARHADLLPSLGGFASWEMDNPSAGSYGGNNWSAGLSLKWNVYSGGSDAAKLQAARSRLEQKKRQLAAMESGMALELHRALVECRSSRLQVEAARAAEAQSAESLRILKNRYDAGLATMTDMLSAETARSAARTAFARSVYLQLLNFARLEHVAGTLSPASKSVAP
jgi:outer membrane protein